jgi:hypothetical protein
MKRVHAILSVVMCLALMGIPTLSNAANVRNQGIMVPAGTPVHVRMIDQISSDQNYAGQTFRGSLDAPVVVHGRTIFPRGAMAHVKLVRAKSAGKIEGRSRLDVQLVSIAGKPVRSNVVEFSGSSQGKKTAKSAGIGAAIGGGAGALLGGGKGLGIGAALGAGAGVAHRAYKGGKPVYVPSESLVNFRLEAPVHGR